MRVSTSWLLGLSLVIAACSNSSPSSVGVSLTAVTDAGRACPNGGVIISTGLDVNGDGELAASEVTATHTVCSGINGSNGSNGGTGHSSLVFTTSLPTGNSHCPYGGTEIDTGLDNGDGGGTADDGILQAGEVDSTQYVCSVETSASGGHNSLVSTTELSSGDRNCPAGGTEIDSGFDNGSGGGTADDGVLQSGEITATQYVCDGSSGNASHDSLVKTTVLDVGDSHCAEGGTQIDSGVDNGAGHGTADDGILQNGEITSTQYVCSGVASPTELVTTTAVAVGDSTCPFGGIVIATGLDNGAGGGTAGDGTLQSGEVTSSNYVCASAPSSLVVTTTLATGSANCPDGGTELDTGLDNGANGGTAGDGILQAGEITASQFICSGPSAPPATFTIDTSGGSGSTGPGGISGTFDLETRKASPGEG